MTTVSLLDKDGATFTATTQTGTLTDASFSITTGGTAQTPLSASTRAKVVIANPDAAEDLWVSITGTADYNAQGSFVIPAGGMVTLLGAEASAAISVKAATTGHKVTAWRVS